MPAHSTRAQLQMLRCHLEASAYAFDATTVRAIHRWENVTAAADAPGAIGTLEGVPVFPLAHLLGLDEDAAASAGPVLLLDGFGIQVERVSRPTTVAEPDLRRLPGPASAAHQRIAGLVRIEGELTLVLEPERLASRGRQQAPPPWPADEPWRQGASGITDKLLCFTPPGHSQDTYLAVTSRQAVEVAQGLRLAQLRSSQGWLAGLVDWRQRAVPVVDVAGLLGIGANTKVDVSRTLIVRAPKSGELFALPANHLAPLPLPLSDDSMVKRTIDPPSPFIRAAYELSEGYLFLPDLDKLAASAAVA